MDDDEDDVCPGGALPLIKGNIGSTARIYHLPGSRYYEQVGFFRYPIACMICGDQFCIY